MEERVQTKLMWKDPKGLSDDDLRIAVTNVCEHRRTLGPSKNTRLLAEAKSRFNLTWAELADLTGYPTYLAFGFVRSNA